jgi:hypothetical protein
LKFCRSDDKYPTVLCSQLFDKPFSLSSSSFTQTTTVVQRNTEQQTDDRQNVSTSYANTRWKRNQTLSAPTWTKRDYFSFPQITSLYCSEYTYYKILHHDLTFFQSKKRKEISYATLSHNLFWQHSPWYILVCLQKDYRGRMIFISEEEMCELLPYLPESFVLVDKFGQNLVTGQLEQQLALFSDWPLLQCLTGNPAGLAAVLAKDYFQIQVMKFYEAADLTYLEIYRIVAYFVQQKRPYQLQPSFFEALGLHFQPRNGFSIYEYYSQLLHIEIFSDTRASTQK